MNKVQMFKNISNISYDKLAMMFEDMGIEISRSTLASRSRSKKGVFLSDEQHEIMIQHFRSSNELEIVNIVDNIRHINQFTSDLMLSIDGELPKDELTSAIDGDELQNQNDIDNLEEIDELEQENSDEIDDDLEDLHDELEDHDFNELEELTDDGLDDLTSDELEQITDIDNEDEDFKDISNSNDGEVLEDINNSEDDFLDDLFNEDEFEDDESQADDLDGSNAWDDVGSVSNVTKAKDVNLGDEFEQGVDSEDNYVLDNIEI